MLKNSSVVTSVVFPFFNFILNMLGKYKEQQ